MSEPNELCAAEKEIFSAIEKNDAGWLRALLADKRDVNVLDENLMTPLQHACYKGNLEMVQLLLDQVEIFFPEICDLLWLFLGG